MAKIQCLKYSPLELGRLRTSKSNQISPDQGENQKTKLETPRRKTKMKEEGEREGAKSRCDSAYRVVFIHGYRVATKKADGGAFSFLAPFEACVSAR
ncbi:hypothetical protein FA13DRAFT_1733291 [Coprinellus micaceus]|uniref:Uncharacterized protein n=1 Tax=Coprinellus micaceus TaxID=71717 RepID=A0A4Y7TAA4_COPMI|nr:hypothetical protein FA13DRAFT_1733291 [Coprinellus micaceus]